MKKYTVFMVLGALLFSLSFASLAFAYDKGEWRTNMEAKRAEFRTTLKTNRETFLAEVKAKKEEFRSLNSERKAQFCRAAGNMVGQRFDSAVKNLEAFQTRLASVIDKLKASGKDTELAQESLDLSKTKLASAKEKLEDLRALVPTSCEGVTAETFEKVKLLSRETKDSLKEVKEDLRQAISALKELRGEDKSEEDENEDN